MAVSACATDKRCDIFRIIRVALTADPTLCDEAPPKRPAKGSDAMTKTAYREARKAWAEKYQHLAEVSECVLVYRADAAIGLCSLQLPTTYTNMLAVPHTHQAVVEAAWREGGSMGDEREVLTTEYMYMRLFSYWIARYFTFSGQSKWHVC